MGIVRGRRTVVWVQGVGIVGAGELWCGCEVWAVVWV